MVGPVKQVLNEFMSSLKNQEACGGEIGVAVEAERRGFVGR
jgi:hypothetical protein